MKKIAAVLLILVMAMSLGACSTEETKETVQDDSAVSMLVTFGNGETYFNKLKEGLKNDLGIEVEFVYENSTNPTGQLEQDFMNNNLSADIIFESSKVNDEYLKGSCVDLLSNSHITKYFTSAKVKECTADDGGVYQLPISSKLIGITYNATLMEEMGWDPPENFEDMLDLKEKCDEAGIKFSVSDFRETGHGFNYLFHIMGAQWISSLDGTGWINGFIDGTESVEAFEKASEYFNKWVENGLFGSINLEAGWGATNEFAKTRALFCFAILNNSSGYEGPQYDDDGNETGVMLNDVHKSMPWISEDGTNNCFTYYDNCWVMVNNDLLAADKKDKLEKVLQILEYMTGEEFAELTTSLSKDIYLSLNNFEMKDDRLYSEYADEIRAGFIQPWYYNYFDSSTIVNTGAEVGSYVVKSCTEQDEIDEVSKNCNYTFDPEVTFESIFEVLNNNNNNRINQSDDILGEIEEKLNYETTAMITAISGGMALQDSLDTAGNNALVTAALLPYAESINDMQPWREVAVENAVLYKGSLTKANCYIIIPKKCGDFNGIWMKGSEIKEIIDNKYDPSGEFIDADTGESVFDSENYGPYPYVCVTKDSVEIEDDTEYLVAVPKAALETAVYEKFEEAGKILTDADGNVITANTSNGIELFFKEHTAVNSENISW